MMPLSKSHKNISDWLEYLEREKPEASIKLGLDRVKSAAIELDLLRINTPVITVAGTNGKGSTVAALEAIYVEAGYRVASFTSPHIFSFNERIKINKKNISDKDLCRAFTFINKASNADCLTYFEFATLSALWYFKQHKLDIIILEVGLGGRLDSTNIVDPTLAVITTIDFDHQQFLGNTIDDIAYEKAGILRNSASLIYADFNIPQAIINIAHNLEVNVYCLGQHYDYKLISSSLSVIVNPSAHYTISNPKLNFKALSAAIFAVNYFNDLLPVKTAAIEKSLCNLSLCGRQQVYSDEITKIYDVAHNPQAACQLGELIASLPHKKVHVVFGALQDKDLSGLITPLIKYANNWFIAKINSIRCADIEKIEKLLREEFNINPSSYNCATDAYAAAIENACPGDLVVVYGSFYMLSEVMRKNYEISN